MQQEQLTELFTFQMTAGEKQILRDLAYEHGATLSGLLRKLIRDAVWKYQGTLTEPSDKPQAAYAHSKEA